MRRFWARYGRRVFFALLATMSILGLVEVVLRVTGWWQLPAEKIYTDVYDPQYEMRPVSLYYEGKIQETLNAHGFRGHDLAPVRAPGVYRIICAGDSTTFGSNVHADQTYAYLLEKELRRRGVAAEVLNAGVPGTWIWPQIKLIRRKLLPLYKPDLIILYTGPSFRADHFVLEATRRGRFSPEPVRRGLAHLAMYRLIRRWLRPPRFEEVVNQYFGGKLNTLSEEKVRPVVWDDLLELRDLCRQNGAKALVIPRVSSAMFERGVRQHFHGGQMGWRTFSRRENATSFMFDLLAKANMPSLDVADSFVDASYRANMFVDAAHFTPAGHAVMADLLADTLCAGHWLPAPCIPAS
jgi:hypothetical protein